MQILNAIKILAHLNGGVQIRKVSGKTDMIDHSKIGLGPNVYANYIFDRSHEYKSLSAGLNVRVWFYG